MTTYPIARISQAIYNSLDDYTPIEFVYKMITPIETELTSDQVDVFKKLYTFEAYTNIICDGEVEIIYYKNTDNGKAVSVVHNTILNLVSNIYDMYATKSELQQLDDQVTYLEDNATKTDIDYTTKTLTVGAGYGIEAHNTNGDMASLRLNGGGVSVNADGDRMFIDNITLNGTDLETWLIGISEQVNDRIDTIVSKNNLEEC